MREETTPATARRGAREPGRDRRQGAARRSRIGGRFFAALALLASAAPVAGQGTISSGEATFLRFAGSFDTEPEANFRGVSAVLAQDHLYEFGWWYRLEGETVETPLGVPDSQTYFGNQSEIVWTDPALPFEAREIVTIVDSGVGGVAYLQLVFFNTSGAPFSVELFLLLDLDVNGAQGDSVGLEQWSPYRVLRIEDAGVDRAYIGTGGGALFLVRPFGSTGVREQLNDATTSDFDNSGIPFESGDVTIGWQFHVEVPNDGGGAGGGVTLMLNPTVLVPQCDSTGTGCFCDGFESGSVLVWSSAVTG